MSIDQSAIVFRRKISSFCEMKLAPLTDSKRLRALLEYMVGLIDNRMPPPVLGRHVNWEEISFACDLGQTSAELRRVAQYGFDAISRWLAETGPIHRKPLVTGKATKTRSHAKSLSSKRKPMTAKASNRLKPGPKPKPIEEYTGRGAISGLLPHGPHNVRDVLATHILKLTGSYEQASYAIQDTPEMVQQHYGRFLPQDKAALAAKILNQVWEAA